MGILSIFNNPSHPGSFWFIVRFHKALPDNESILLLLLIGLLSNPDINVFFKLKDESIVRIQHLSR
jgi:hypothetical protein